MKQATILLLVLLLAGTTEAGVESWGTNTGGWRVAISETLLGAQAGAAVQGNDAFGDEMQAEAWLAGRVRIEGSYLQFKGLANRRFDGERQWWRGELSMRFGGACKYRGFELDVFAEIATPIKNRLYFAAGAGGDFAYWQGIGAGVTVQVLTDSFLLEAWFGLESSDSLVRLRVGAVYSDPRILNKQLGGFVRMEASWK